VLTGKTVRREYEISVLALSTNYAKYTNNVDNTFAQFKGVSLCIETREETIEIRDRKLEIRDANMEIQDANIEIRDRKLEIRDANIDIQESLACS